jgi:hypothetical protein
MRRLSGGGMPLMASRAMPLRYAPKRVAHPRTVFKQESERLRLSAQFESLLEPLMTLRVPGSRSLDG